MSFRWILRLDPRARIYRLARFVWERGPVGDGNGYSSKLSVALSPGMFRVRRSDLHEWTLTILGLRWHHIRSYGGKFPA